MHPDADNPAAESPRYLDRELSWLEFNARVLALAENASLPLLERAKFLAIFSSNLDEFFQVRVSGLKEQLEAGIRPTSQEGIDQAEQLARDPRPRRGAGHPAGRGVHQGGRARARRRRASSSATGTTSTPTARTQLTSEFDDRIFPVLTPLAVDPAHPFPYISSLSLNLAVVVRDASQRRAALRAGQGPAAAPPLRRRARAAPASSRSSR